MTDNKIPTYKLILVGDGGVGKTTFFRRHLTGGFDSKYITNASAQVKSLSFTTTSGAIQFDLWDYVVHEMRSRLRDSYYTDSNCAIIMFDVTSRLSYKNVTNWHRDVVQACGNIPIVLCGNKVEVKGRKVKAKQIHFHRKMHLQYYEISAKANYNLEKPFLWFARRLTDVADLGFVATPALAPAEAEFSAEDIKATELALEEASLAPIPREDDDLEAEQTA